MEETRQENLPVAADGEAMLPPPHFDDEATLLARPVVPLNPDVVRQSSPGRASQSVRTQTPRRSALFLAMVIAAAALAGAAAALGIDFVRSRRPAASPIIAQPAATEARVAVKSAQELGAAQPPAAPAPTVAVAKAAETPSPAPSPAVVAPTPETAKRATTHANGKSLDPAPKERPVAVNPNPADGRTATPAAGNENRQGDQKAANQKKASPKQPRSSDGDDDVPPLRPRRTQQDLGRIREIFEGRQP